MSSPARVLAVGLIAVGATTIFRPIQHRIQVAGIFRPELNTAFAEGDFVAIPDTTQCEDVHHYLPSNELFAACEDDTQRRFSWFPPLANFKDPNAVGTGSIHVINPETFKSRRLTLEEFKGTFITHGVDVIPDPDIPGSVYIFAVNHPPNPACTPDCPPGEPRENAAVEVFQHVLGSDIARHVSTVRHPLIRLPNDIFATSPTSFYVTNDHYYAEGHLRAVEDVFPTAKWSDTVFVHFSKPTTTSTAPTVDASVALSGMHNNNGLGHAWLHTGGEVGDVLIGSAAGGVIYRATIASEPKNANLTVFEEISLDSCIDNPSYFSDPYAESTGRDASGYTTGGLARAWKLADHAHDPDAKDPVIVWHVKKATSAEKGKKPKEKWVKKALFQDEGDRIRSASAAVIVAIDPKKEGGKKMGWLFVTGFFSKNMIAVKVDLDW